MDLYEYAIIRLVPDIEREEFINIGLIMLCKRKRWLEVKVLPVPRGISRQYDNIDITNIERYLESYVGVGKGDCQRGPVAVMEPEERFRWLTAMKSAMIQTSRPHPGLTESLNDTFNNLFERLVMTKNNCCLMEQKDVN